MNILIHIGPPKSGTSAIQKWLLNNVEELKGQGVFYPKHLIDPNGVSSGNLLSLFTRVKKGKLEFSETKKQELLRDFELSGCSTLLLSSEFFFLQHPILAEVFPTAKFIAYLRYPVEVIESSYNQGVKRHGEVKKLGVPAKPKSFQLKTLERFIKSVGKERYILRPYHDACYVGGSLISDFCHVLGLPSSVCHSETNHERVNTSYSLDALEFKRWFNQFQLGELQPVLDRFLQSYSANATGYSLIPAKTFNLYKEEYVSVLQNFCNNYDVHASDLFVKECMAIQQKPFKRQDISDEDFERLLKQFFAYKNVAQQSLYNKLVNDWDVNADIKKPERIAMIKKNVSFFTKLSILWFSSIQKYFRKISFSK
ncbi:hypothetical protein GTH32_10875 [Alteromonas sp. 345S023]|uniref:Sulfotransferase domain-containing protein n=1 Tax=Alteromonas profundi TaxID=2696062 RepID=A0A7X5LLR5_9ALTE|nr:hypothetical protein [Alteromonas profundi]NDV91686.1 hypothetical protein [Alteromonas profundi]